MNDCYLADGFPDEHYLKIKEALFKPDSAIYLPDETIVAAYFGKIINNLGKSIEIDIPYKCGFLSGCDDYILITDTRIVIIQFQKKKKIISFISFEDIHDLKITKMITKNMKNINKLHILEKPKKEIFEFQIKSEKDLYGIHSKIRSYMSVKGWKADLSGMHNAKWTSGTAEIKSTSFFDIIDRVIQENGKTGQNHKTMKDQAIGLLSMIHDELQYAELFDDDLTHSSKLLDGLLKSLQNAHNGMFDMSSSELKSYLKQLDYEYSIILCKIGKELNSCGMTSNPYKYDNKIVLVYRSHRALSNYLWEFPWVIERAKIIEYAKKVQKIEETDGFSEWADSNTLFKWQWQVPNQQGIPSMLPTHSATSSVQAYIMGDSHEIFNESMRIDNDGYLFGQKCD